MSTYFSSVPAPVINNELFHCLDIQRWKSGELVLPTFCNYSQIEWEMFKNKILFELLDVGKLYFPQNIATLKWSACKGLKAMSHEAIFLTTCNAIALHSIPSYKEDYLVWHPMFATSLTTKSCVPSSWESRSSFYYSQCYATSCSVWIFFSSKIALQDARTNCLVWHGL